MNARPTDLYLGREPHEGKTDIKAAGMAADAQANPRMLDIALRTGNHQALPYPYLVTAKIIGNAKIELLFTESQVTITGRNLLPVYQQLIAQTVWRLEESGTGFDDPKLESWIETITIVARPTRG